MPKNLNTDFIAFINHITNFSQYSIIGLKGPKNLRNNSFINLYRYFIIVNGKFINCFVIILAIFPLYLSIFSTSFKISPKELISINIPEIIAMNKNLEKNLITSRNI